MLDIPAILVQLYYIAWILQLYRKLQ